VHWQVCVIQPIRVRDQYRVNKTKQHTHLRIKHVGQVRAAFTIGPSDFDNILLLSLPPILYEWPWHDALHVWHDALKLEYVTWCIQMWDMTHWYVWYDPFIRAAWFIYMVWHDSFIFGACLIHACDIVLVFITHQVRMKWLITVCDTIHSYYVWDSKYVWLILRLWVSEQRVLLALPSLRLRTVDNIQRLASACI